MPQATHDMMRAALLPALLLAALLYPVAMATPYTCQHNITLNCSPNCNGFSEALGKVKAHDIKESVCVKLSNGTFYLNSLVNATLSHVRNLTIIGGGSSVVECNRTGLTFLNSTGIYLENVSFKFCGALHNSTSRNISASGLSYVEIYTALYFMFCSDITMVNVNVFYSDSSGVVLYNNGGNNKFHSCAFHTSLHKGPGGSGVSIDFSYCVPGDLECSMTSSTIYANNGSTHTFENCKFHDNNAVSDLKQNVVYPHGTDHMVLGKGGGASASFGGHSNGNTITFEECNFELNQANVGGGLYILFSDVSVNNTLEVMNSSFSSNSMNCDYEQQSKWTASGGGVKIEFIYYPPDSKLWPGYISKVEDNTVKFSGSTFYYNYVCYGGAVSMVTSRSRSGTNTNSLIFDTCNFLLNTAQLSSAVDLSLHYPDEHGGLPVQPVFADCTFDSNHITIGNINHYPLGMGALYSDRIPFNLTGHNTFVRNDGTAMVVLSTYVVAMQNSTTDFVGNHGRLGGAIALYGNAWIVSHIGSSFNFSDNSVKPGGLGGAIYAVQFGGHDNINQNCFFQYYKPTVPPSKWSTSFVFTNNTANGTSNSIYTTSVQPCKWPSNNSTTSNFHHTDDVFCAGHPSKFVNSNCQQEISTASSTLIVPPNTQFFFAVPGWPTPLNVTAVDDYEKTIQTVLVAFPSDKDVGHIGVNQSTEYISNKEIVLYGKKNVPSLLKLRTLDPRVIASQLGVEILACPPGFISVQCVDNPEMVCDCVCPASSNALNCSPRNITLFLYHCMTYQYEENNRSAPNKSLPLVLGKCPFNLINPNLPQKADELDAIVCGPLKRTGVLCSQCIENHGVAINGRFQCVLCNPALGWLWFLLIKILPITALFLLVAIFNFKATSPAINGFVFFAQIVSTNHYNNPFPFAFGIISAKIHDIPIVSDVLIALVQTPYAILNLEFFERVFPPVCVGNVSTLVVLALRYVMALYPLLLIFVCYGCIKLYDNNVRVVRIVWKPFKHCIDKFQKRTQTNTSIIDAIATFLLFSYTTFVHVSFPILNSNMVTIKDASNSNHTPIHDQRKFYYDASLDAFGQAYLLIFTMVIVIIGIFVVVPPLFFLLYPLKIMQRCISRLPKNIAIKTFAESFNECYRNGTERRGGWDFRYFAGLYFLFRIAMLIVMVSDLKWADQYFIQQVLLLLGMMLFAVARPYKEDRYNHLDTLMFALLSLLNACSFYNSQIINSTTTISLPVFIINYSLLFIPLIYVIIYAGWYFMLSLNCCSRRFKNESWNSESIIIISDTSSNQGDEEPMSFVYEDSNREQTDEFPDRVVNPQNYRKKYKSRAPKITVTKATGDRESGRERQGNTENSYFLDRSRHSYGSVERSQTDPQEIRKLV
ncbi:uncharacterized protein LOC135342585 [Halichondria panicea]|uniref:uncharacterized protein LOC135342585 n=1 Tax=Halichondria panicea TaxID=6063 RepID=UPI00312BA532